MSQSVATGPHMRGSAPGVLASQSRIENVINTTSVPHLTQGGHKDAKHQALLSRWKANHEQGALAQAEARARVLARSDVAKERDKGLYMLAKFHGDAQAAEATLRRVLLAGQEVSAKALRRSKALKALKAQLDGTVPAAFVPAINLEGNRPNMLPLAYASWLAELFGGSLETSLVNTSTDHGTNMGKAERAYLQAHFALRKPWTCPQQVVLVDDQWTSGKTVLALWATINELQGCDTASSPVVAVTTLSASYKGIRPHAESVARLLELSERTEDAFRQEFGYALTDCTESWIQSALTEYRRHAWQGPAYLSTFFPRVQHKSGSGAAACPQADHAWSEAAERIYQAALCGLGELTPLGLTWEDIWGKKV